MSPSRLTGKSRVPGNQAPLRARLLPLRRGDHHVTATMRRRVRRLRALRVPLLILMLLAIVATLVWASSLLIPLVLAAFIALALNPIVVGLHDLYVPRALGAVLVMLVLGGIVGGGVVGLSSPASHWMHEAPHVLNDVGYKLERMTRPLTRVGNAASRSLARIGVGAAPAVKATPATGFSGFSMHDIVSAAPRLIVAVLTVALLVFFFLSYGRDVAAHLVTAMPGFGYRRVALRLIRGIQQEFSRYLLTVTLINIGLGLATAAVLWGLKVPDPLLWGGMVTLLNFMPYIGAITNALLLLAVGLLDFSAPWHALAPAACFAALAILEGNFVTPWVMGKRMRLSPLAILVWLLVWAWLWGIPGALLAVPMLTCCKLIAEWTPGWGWFARMVGR